MVIEQAWRQILVIHVTSINSEWLYQVEFVNVLGILSIDHFFALREDSIKTIGRFSVRNCDHVDMLGRSWKTKGVVSVVWIENTEFRSELVCSHSWYFMGISKPTIDPYPGKQRHVMLFTSCFFWGGQSPQPEKCNKHHLLYTGGSKNRGTPKWMGYSGKPY